MIGISQFPLKLADFHINEFRFCISVVSGKIHLLNIFPQSEVVFSSSEIRFSRVSIFCSDFFRVFDSAVRASEGLSFLAALPVVGLL